MRNLKSSVFISHIKPVSYFVSDSICDSVNNFVYDSVRVSVWDSMRSFILSK